jgi:HAD superfamily hydrolase (TIGR01509 family)
VNIKAILFDLDGVLVDATEWHFEALNRALALFSYTISRYEHLTAYNGLPTRKKLEMLSVEKGLPRGLHNVLNQIKQKYTREEILRQCAPSFEKEFMIHQLKRDGFKLAVCSNSVRESVELMLRGAGLLPLFDFIASNEDVQKPKPDPEMYLMAFSRLQLTPSECVIVEDAGHGIEAARRSGAHVCHVTGFGDVDYDRIRGFLQGIEKGDATCSRS